MTDTPPEPTPAETAAADQAAANTHTVIEAGTGTSNFEPDPHPLDGKAAPTAATLEVGTDAEGMAHVTAAWDEFLGNITVTASHLMHDASTVVRRFHFSGRDTPKTVHLDTTGADQVSVSVHTDTGQIAEQTFPGGSPAA